MDMDEKSMTTTSNNEPTLRDLADKIDNLSADLSHLQTDVSQLKTDVSQLKTDVSNMQTELNQTQKWQDRTWDVIKWVGGISAGLAISASIALVGLFIKFATIGQ